MKNLFQNKTILITGGTGFLGRVLTKEILKHNPQSIRLFSRDEVKHHKVQELFNYSPKIRNFIGDVRDYSRLVKATRNADIVIHAAALKRLDILEYNVEEAIKTNIIGTLNIINASLFNRVKKVVFVSSDKACSPVNTYGACKFVGERIFSESNYSKGDIKTIFTTVRYGNVLESTGSVIPFFTSLIRQGKDIPLTDPEMTRFLITPKQAVELITKALKYGKGGEIFVPKLSSFKIIDLIEILKKSLETKSQIKITGIRPGEKIHELMINESEIPRTIAKGSLFIIQSSIGEYSLIKRKKAKTIKANSVKKLPMKNYSSKNHIISQREVKKIFEKIGII